MRLVDLRPRWLEFNGERIAIMFLCPHCVAQSVTNRWVTCFFKPAGGLPKDEEGERGEYRLFREAFASMGLPPETWITTCKPECKWTRSSDDFATMSITPSIDASASGHWHGHITNGEIR